MWELMIIAIGLSMDAFAVTVCKGLSLKTWSRKRALLTGLYFGGFQAIMPLIGYVLGVQFQSIIVSIDYWIAFILLGVIGLNTIKDSRENVEEVADSFSIKEMVSLALATSIDALAVGITFAFLRAQIIPAISFIGVITFSLSVIGVAIGNKFGTRYRSIAELGGGIILILMGLKIVIEHTGIL